MSGRGTTSQSDSTKKDKVQKVGNRNKTSSATEMVQVTDSLISGATGTTIRGHGSETLAPPTPNPETFPKMFTNVNTNRDKEKEEKSQKNT